MSVLRWQFVGRFLPLLLGLCSVGWLSAQERPDADKEAGLRLFEAKIRPLLVQHCYQCHSAKAADPAGSLLLDSRDGLLKGGDRGPGVVPGKPEESWLLKAISHSEDDLRMPPKKDRLAASLLQDVAEWIRLGAPDPRDAAVPRRAGIDFADSRKFWAFQPPGHHPPPATQHPDWCRSAIDHFVLAGLESAGLTPSADARPTTLLRRLNFDLTGLPPTPDAVATFLQRVDTDGFELAWQREVDALLASPRFGERWGRHWLDVARFAESSGKEANISFPYAWRYRDYVIDAFNNDLPYDRFLIEQLAGDQLPAADDKERARLLIATGFLALGPKNLDEANEKQFWSDLVDEQIDTVTRALMGQSVACARCHDHKFDPYAMDDYYALAGIFASTKTYFGTFVSPANRIGGDPLPLPRGAGEPIFHAGIPARQVEALKKQLAALQKEREAGMAASFKAAAEGKDPGEVFTIRDALRIFWQSGGIEGQLEKVDDEGRPLPLAMGVLDRKFIINARLLEAGDLSKPGRQIPRAFPRIFELSDQLQRPGPQSGRLELAQWLTHPRHPLTARVLANRVWQHLLGAGLVRSVDNFGITGTPPSHPQLLDELTLRFQEQGWSVKHLVREIVLSRVYRQASTFRADAFQTDPDNQWLWRHTPRRLDAEEIRDAMLVVSGELDPVRPEGSLVARVIGDRPISLIGLDPKIPADLDGTRSRSVYLPVLRDRLPDVLDLFDFAEPSLVTGARETTNVPLQALYLMNSPFVLARAQGLARRLKAEPNTDAALQRAFQLCFSRLPDPAELAAAHGFVDRGLYEACDDEEAKQRVWSSYCQALLATAEFRNLD